MSIVELERIIEPYEFEYRGNLFIEAVAEAAKDYSDLLVEVVNKTLMDLEANMWATKTSLIKNKPNLYRKAFIRGVERDTLSTTEMMVMVSVHGNKKGRINEYRKIVDKLAKELGGKKYEEDDNENQNQENEYKYYLYVDYCFRG